MGIDAATVRQAAYSEVQAKATECKGDVAAKIKSNEAELEALRAINKALGDDVDSTVQCIGNLQEQVATDRTGLETQIGNAKREEKEAIDAIEDVQDEIDMVNADTD